MWKDLSSQPTGTLSKARKTPVRQNGEQRQVPSLTKLGPPSSPAAGHHCSWVSHLRIRPNAVQNGFFFLVLHLQRARHAYFLASGHVSQSLKTYLHVQMCVYICEHICACKHMCVHLGAGPCMLLYTSACLCTFSFENPDNLDTKNIDLSLPIFTNPLLVF